jgi:hypothetical protein
MDLGQLVPLDGAPQLAHYRRIGLKRLRQPEIAIRVGLQFHSREATGEIRTVRRRASFMSGTARAIDGGHATAPEPPPSPAFGDERASRSHVDARPLGTSFRRRSRRGPGSCSAQAKRALDWRGGPTIRVVPSGRVPKVVSDASLSSQGALRRGSNRLPETAGFVRWEQPPRFRAVSRVQRPRLSRPAGGGSFGQAERG